MEYVVVISVIVFLVIYFLAQDSRKETTKEQIGEAVGKLTQMVADEISGAAFSITEPADKKKLRLAREALASKNGSLYRFEHYSQKEYLEFLLRVDDYFKRALDTLGLSEERWKKIALMLYYIGAIRIVSRDSSDYSKKLPKTYREDILSNRRDRDTTKTLIKALDFFNISIEEWIDFGDSVIEMHDLRNDPDIQEFGYVHAIMPMQNNMHLL